MFVGAVAKHRGVPEAAVRNGMGQGRLLDAQRAKREGMVDGVATIDEVVRKLAQRVDRSSTKPVRMPVASPAQTRSAALQRVIDMFNI